MKNGLALAFLAYVLSACGAILTIDSTEPPPSDFFKGTDSTHWRQKYDLPVRPF